MRNSRSVCALPLACLIVSASTAVLPAAAQSVSYEVSTPQLTELKVLTAKAMRLYRNGKIKAAVGAFESAAAKARQHFGPEHQRFAQSLNNLALIYDVFGALERSEETYRQAITIVEAQNGAQPMQLANLQNNLAAVVLQQCRVADAHALYKRALALSDKTHGPYSVDTTMVRENVSRLDRYLGTPTPTRTPVSVAGDGATDISKLLQRCMS